MSFSFSYTFSLAPIITFACKLDPNKPSFLFSSIAVVTTDLNSLISDHLFPNISLCQFMFDLK